MSYKLHSMVPTLAVMPDHLAAAPPGNYLGPYAADALNTELVRPRMTQAGYTTHQVCGSAST